MAAPLLAEALTLDLEPLSASLTALKLPEFWEKLQEFAVEREIPALKFIPRLQQMKGSHGSEGVNRIVFRGIYWRLE
jgi:hypothetical protein